MKLVETLHERSVLGRRMRVLSEQLASYMPPNASVLDVGCGSGQIAQNIMGLRPDVTIRGIDVLVREGTAIPVEKYDGSRFPAADNAYDVVTFVDVLHHTENVVELLREAGRVASQLIVIKDHTKNGPFAGARLSMMDRVGNRRFGVHVNYNYWAREQWQQAFGELNLRVVHWQPRVNLYGWPLNVAFDSTLQFIAVLAPLESGASK